MNNQVETLKSAFEILSRALRPFVEAHLQPVYGDKWEAAAKKGTSAERGNRAIDLAALLSAIHSNRSLFAADLTHLGQAYTSELRHIRNRWAHQGPISEDDADRALDTASRLLRCIKAENDAEAMDSLRGKAAPPLLNRLVYIARSERGGIYTEEDLDYEQVWKKDDYLIFKSYDRHAQVVYVKVHVDVAMAAVIGDVSADDGFDIDEDMK